MKKLLLIGAIASLAACELPPPVAEMAAPVEDMPMTEMAAPDAGAEQATPTDIVPAN